MSVKSLSKILEPHRGQKDEKVVETLRGLLLELFPKKKVKKVPGINAVFLAHGSVYITLSSTHIIFSLDPPNGRFPAYVAASHITDPSSLDETSMLGAWHSCAMMELQRRGFFKEFLGKKLELKFEEKTGELHQVSE